MPFLKIGGYKNKITIFKEINFFLKKKEVLVTQKFGNN